MHTRDKSVLNNNKVIKPFRYLDDNQTSNRNDHYQR